MIKKIGRYLLVMLLVFSGQSLIAGNYDFVVAQDGTGNFTSIQKAIDASKAFPDSRITIFVKNGTYIEKIQVPSCNTKLSIIGENVEKTIISYNDFFDKINRGRNSTFYTSTLLVQAGDFMLENITVQNTAGPVGQAVALHVEADQCVFLNCRFLGFQDTVYAAGRYSRMLFQNCHIEGTTDFIFGEATALFDKCTIYCKADSYITAASTPKGRPFGFVFNDCVISAAPGVKSVYLGRPWRTYAKVVFLKCEMDSFICRAGWHNWDKPDAEKTTFFAEYKNSDPGASTEKRAKWSHQLKATQAAAYAPEQILGVWIAKFK